MPSAISRTERVPSRRRLNTRRRAGSPRASRARSALGTIFVVPLQAATRRRAPTRSNGKYMLTVSQYERSAAAGVDAQAGAALALQCRSQAAGCGGSAMATGSAADVALWLPFTGWLPHRDVKAVPHIDVGNCDDQGCKGGLIVVPCRLGPDLIRDRVRSIAHARQGVREG